MSENYRSLFFFPPLIPLILGEKRQAVMLLNFWKFYASTFSMTCSVDVVKSFAVFVTKAVFNEKFAGTK